MEKTTGLKTALIITGGYCNTERAKKLLPDSVLLTVAADSGCDTAKLLGITPDIALGDFDSISGDLPDGVPVLRVPREKDVTDTMLACDYAIRNGCNDLVIVGGTGGRLDHYLSNVLYLEELRRDGVYATLTDGENTARVISDETVNVAKTDGYFSVFALDSCVITETGCKYPLSDATLVREHPYALSNEVIGDSATVTVKGSAILVTSMR